MKFSDLPLRLRHDVASLSPEKAQRLAEDLRPFVEFCAGQGHGRVEELLNAILIALKGWVPGGLMPHDFEENINNLADEAALNSLNSLEPGFFSHEINVFTRLGAGQRDRFVAFDLEYPLLRKVLEEVFRKRFRLVRNYDRTFRIRDLFDCDHSMMICSRILAQKLLDHGFPPGRIVYMDFWETSPAGFRGRLIFPFKLADLQGIIP
jgi:hypothetical protein